MTVTVRFAPSPTGYLHIGNARPALMNWLFALREGGRFILRYDDTDLERSREAYAQAIGEDLEWLGIVPHEVFRQSDRLAHYDAAVEQLAAGASFASRAPSVPSAHKRRRARLAVSRTSIFEAVGEQREKFYEQRLLRVLPWYRVDSGSPSR